MQDIPNQFETALKRGYAIKGEALVIAEWNYNNLFEVDVTNPPDETNWIFAKDYFAVKNVVNNLGTDSGIFYAFTDESYTDGSSLGLDANRYYTIDESSPYKYWICPTLSNLDAIEGEEAGFPETRSYAISNHNRVEVDYKEYLNMNKVSVTFNLGPVPVDWSIYVWEENAAAWVEIANPIINTLNGRCEIWWNGTDWVQTQQLDETVYQRISKVAIEVRTVDAALKRLMVIEIAGKREIDITERTEEYNINASMDDESMLYPIGRMSSNDGGITFNNNDLKMNHDDPTSDFYGALKGWCQYRTYVDFDLTPFGGTHYIARTGTMYANDWQQVNEYQYQIELFDIFKILQSVNAPTILIENQSIARIVASLLDGIGWDKYRFEADDFDDNATAEHSNNVKYFWSDGTKKMFEVLDDLCRSHQAALFVDEEGYIRLRTRRDITPVEGEEPVWIFNGKENGFDIPDIIQLQKKYNLQINKITINYTRREAKTDDIDIREQPLTAALWEADETIVLRASPLVRPMTESFEEPGAGLNDIWVSGTAAETWPFKGKVNINGELMEYEGKGYAWWDHSSGSPVYNENLVMNNDERKEYDRKSWTSFKTAYTDQDPASPTYGQIVQIIGGISKDPAQQNHYTGRLRPKTRDLDGSGQQKAHSTAQSYGWYTMDFWTNKGMSDPFPGKYFTPGSTTYNLANLKDWVNKPGWREAQARATVQNSIITIDNTKPTLMDPSTHATVCIKDAEDTEYREIGTRLRHRKGTKGRALVAFYMSNAVGYDNENIQLTEAHYANRCYVVNVSTTEYCESVDRSINEITVQVKNGDNISLLPQMGFGNGGKVKIDADKWYDIDIVFRDGVGAIREGGTADLWDGQSTIEVYVDGAFMDTWHTTDNIRPTSLFAVGSRDASIVDFEYIYGSTTTSKGRIKYKDDELFDAYTLELPAGTNQTKLLELPWEGDWLGEVAVSMSTWSAAANILDMELLAANSTASKKLTGPNGLLLKPDHKLTMQMNQVMTNSGRLKIKYTATKDIAVVVETSRVRNYPYGIDNEPIPPPSSYYDFLKGGYMSTKRDDMFFTPQKYFNSQFLSHEITTPIWLGYFYEDFGSIVHEVRDFDVEFDAAPAKGTSVYISNPKVRQIGYQYSPVRGKFTLVNASHRDEIVAGSEELDDSSSIDHTLMVYGYVIEDKGDETEELKDELSIKKYGVIAEEINADWIFTKEEAKALADWIITHWSDSMDTISMTVFSSTHIQIGDKVQINYPNASINPDWIYVVTAKNISWSEGLEVEITVRRVR